MPRLCRVLPEGGERYLLEENHDFFVGNLMTSNPKSKQEILQWLLTISHHRRWSEAFKSRPSCWVYKWLLYFHSWFAPIILQSLVSECPPWPRQLSTIPKFPIPKIPHVQKVNNILTETYCQKNAETQQVLPWFGRQTEAETQKLLPSAAQAEVEHMAVPESYWVLHLLLCG